MAKGSGGKMAKAALPKAPAKRTPLPKHPGAPRGAKAKLPVNSGRSATGKRAYMKRSPNTPGKGSASSKTHPGPSAGSTTMGTWTLQLPGPGTLQIAGAPLGLGGNQQTGLKL